MNRVLGQALTIVATALLATTLTPACAENDRSIFIRGALAPPQSRQGNVCSYSADPSQHTLFEGTLDAAVKDSYESVLLVGNQLMARADNNGVRSESNRAHLNGAVVRVTDPNGATLGEFTTLASGFVDMASGGNPSFGSVAVTAIDAPTTAKIAPGIAPGQTRLVTANIKVFGSTVGGVDLESGEFQFPIRICNGCLVTFTIDPASPNVKCPAASTASGAGTGGGEIISPCRPGQDEPTPCQFCQDRPICR